VSNEGKPLVEEGREKREGKKGKRKKAMTFK
jgi:hypothetical protein